MLQRQVPSTRPIQGGRRVLPAEGQNEEGPLALAPIPPRPQVPRRKERSRGDTTREGGERKNTTRYRGLTQADPGTAGRKGMIPKKQGRLPTEGSEPASPDTPPPGGRPRTSQDGGRIGIQPRKTEERGGRGEERKPEARATEPRAKDRVEKSWAEVARFGQLSIEGPMLGGDGS